KLKPTTFHTTLFTTFPSRKAPRFATATSINLLRAACDAQAWCGVTIQLVACNNGFVNGGGSSDKTSSPAPASWLLFRAEARSDSLIRAPRLTFSRNAEGFIMERRFRFTNPWFSSLREQWSDTTSDARKHSSISVN